MDNTKRKQCCKCFKTFYNFKYTYKTMNDGCVQDYLDGYCEPDYEVIDKRLCPHCESEEHIVV